MTIKRSKWNSKVRSFEIANLSKASADGTLDIPDYCIGDVISKGNECKKGVITAERERFQLDNEKHYTVREYKGHLTTGRTWSALELAILGYRVVRRDTNVLDKAKDERDKEQKKKDKMDSLCNGGDPIPLKDCEVVTGDNPLTSSNVKFKGHTCVDVKAKCCHCGKKVRVCINKHLRSFFLKKHKPKGGKRKIKLQRTKSTIRFERTKKTVRFERTRKIIRRTR